MAQEIEPSLEPLRVGVAMQVLLIELVDQVRAIFRAAFDGTGEVRVAYALPEKSRPGRHAYRIRLAMQEVQVGELEERHIDGVDFIDQGAGCAGRAAGDAVADGDDDRELAAVHAGSILVAAENIEDAGAADNARAGSAVAPINVGAELAARKILSRLAEGGNYAINARLN